ncbi:MAG: response regulator, partial [Planctomycetes bacterium]|nr:response regulator [Planctomycetota bacterium]
VMLPGLSGYEVCKQLKSSRATRAIPVLMLTALDRHLDRQRGFEAGADDYLTKPFTPDGLVAQLQACLDAARLAGDACNGLVRTLELTASLADLKAFNALATCLYCHTDLAVEKIEALRQGLVQVAEAAGRWATAHGGPSPVRLVVDLNAERLRLAFEPASAEGGAFLTEHLDAEAAVPAALVDAGVVDRITPADGRVVLETAVPPRA